jgi:hypothetical protein
MQNMEREGRKNNVMTETLVLLRCLMSDVLAYADTRNFKFQIIDSIGLGLINEVETSSVATFLSSEF